MEERIPAAMKSFDAYHRQEQGWYDADENEYRHMSVEFNACEPPD